MINFPSLQNIIDRIKTDIRKLLPSLDPNIENSFAYATVTSLGGRVYDIYLKIEQLLVQFFPTTSTGEYLDRWAEYEGITRSPASVAFGNVVFQGTLATNIPLGTQIKNSEGSIYETQADINITNSTIGVTITRSGSTAIVTLSSNHNLASGVSVDISGADQSEYNGTFVVTVTSASEFTYDIAGTPVTPATGTIMASYDTAYVEIQSVDTGSDKNLNTGIVVSLITHITGVDYDALVDFNGIKGGADLESDSDLRVRVLQSRTNPVANFNVAAIEKQALSVAGVTKVFIKRITPYIGAVTVYFLRENDDNPIPDAGEIEQVREVIVDILPANSSDDDVFVLAPTGQNVDFTFTSIIPDTTTMRNSIEQNIIALFEDNNFFETTMTEDKYRSAIIQSFDSDTGNQLESFTLSTPTGDVSSALGTVLLKGDVIF